MRPKAPLCIDKKGCGLGKSRRDSRPLRGPTPLLGHAGRRLEGGAPGDGRNKFGLRLHAALTKRAVAWGEDVTLCPSYTLNSRMPSIALLAPVAIPLATAGAAATLAIVQLDVEDPKASRPPWGVLLAAWLALSWVGAILQVRSGTALYSAVPVSALTVPVFMLLAAAALIASGLYPWRGWASQLWGRPALRSAGLAVATLYPLGFYLLVRAYEMGDGRYPQFWMQAALAGIGVLVAVGAAVRAQGASTRREYLGEVIPGLGGFALIGISLGTPLGLVAGLATLAVAAVLAAGLPLLPDRAGPAP